jgi:hypothetical protein
MDAEIDMATFVRPLGEKADDPAALGRVVS